MVAASQEISCIFLYSRELTPPLGPTRSQSNPVHALSFCFFKIHADITVPSKRISSKRSVSFWFPLQNSVFLICMLATCCGHLVALEGFVCTHRHTPYRTWFYQPYNTTGVLLTFP